MTEGFQTPKVAYGFLSEDDGLPDRQPITHPASLMAPRPVSEA